MTSGKLSTREITVWVFAFAIVFAGFTCEKGSQIIKVATYNIYFLDDGISVERKANLRKVIELLDADIIGFQEIEDPAALKNILPPNYQVAMIDDSSEVQELAIAVRSPLKVQSVRYVFPDTSADNAFPRKRDLLQGTIEAYGRDLVVLVHHAKSRRGGRMATDGRRAAASALMVDYIASDLAGRNVLLLGDFNDNPDDRSVNILEYGDKEASGGVDSEEDRFLFNTSEQLLREDFCSYGYSYLFEEVDRDTFDLTVQGARAENNKWRNTEHNYFEDVKVKAILLDMVLVSLNLKPAVLETGVFNYAVGVAGEPSRIRFGPNGLTYTNRGSLSSDHVPVWTLFDLGKL